MSTQRDKFFDVAIRTVVLLLKIALVLLFWLVSFVIFVLPTWLYWLGNLVVIGYSIVHVYTSGIYLAWRSAFSRYRSPQASTPQLPYPIEVARLSFKLDNPEGDEALDKFLDEPLYRSNTIAGQLASPSQVTEVLVLNHVKDIESGFPNMIIVEAEVHRGSLFVTLTYLATAYTLMSQYNDFVDSISRIRQQMRRTFAMMSGDYRERTQRNIRIRSDLSVKYRSRNSFSDPDGNSSSGTSRTQPVTITNAYNPPANSSNFNITVNPPNSRSSGCLSSLVVIFLLSLVVGGLYFYFVLDTQTKLETLATIVEQIILWLRQAGQFLIDLGAYIEYESFGR